MDQKMWQKELYSFLHLLIKNVQTELNVFSQNLQKNSLIY